MASGPLPAADADAVFMMHAQNTSTGKTTEQRMTFAQLMSSTNPFLQNGLKEYLKLKAAK